MLKPVYNVTFEVATILSKLEKLQANTRSGKTLHLFKKDFDILYSAIRMNHPVDKNRIPYTDGFFIEYY